AQHRLGHAGVAEPGERGNDERAGESPSPPRSPNRHAVQPTAPNTKGGVLHPRDLDLNAASDLSAVPRDPPERRVEVRPGEDPDEVFLGGFAMAPAVAEGLVVGVEDRAMILRLDRVEVEAIG